MIPRDSNAFDPDAAADYLGAVTTNLEETIFTFVAFMSTKALEQDPLGPSRFEEARAALVLLNILARAGCYKPDHGAACRAREALLAYFDAATHGESTVRGLFRQAITRDLDELVMHAEATGDARPVYRQLGTGGVERLLLRAGAPDLVAQWTHAFGDDFAGAWAKCPRGDWLVVLAEAAGVDGRRLFCVGFAALFGLAAPPLTVEDALAELDRREKDTPRRDPDAIHYTSSAFGRMRSAARMLAKGTPRAGFSVAYALGEASHAATANALAGRALPLSDADRTEVASKRPAQLAEYARFLRAHIDAPTRALPAAGENGHTK